MNERLKAIRNDVGLSMKKFADRLNISDSTVSLMESGKRNITDRTISDICREFGVSESWLRTGEGEMYEQPADVLELGELAAAMYNDPNPLKRRLIKILMDMDMDELEAAEKILKRVFEDEGIQEILGK